MSALIFFLLVSVARAEPLLPAGPPLAPPKTDQAITERVAAQLDPSDPQAAELFRQAAAAHELGELPRAGELYAAVTRLEPQLDHAWRRHCTVLQEAGMRSLALPRCEQALALSSRPENQVAMAYVLLDVPSGNLATQADDSRALQLLQSAWAQDPDDPMNARLRCHLAMDQDDLDLLGACVADLQRVAPNHVMTGFYAWALAFRQSRWRAALVALDQAQVAGMPAMDADSFRRLTLRARPWYWTWGPALAAGGVLGGLTLVLGRRLGRRSPPVRHGDPTPGEGRHPG